MPNRLSRERSPYLLQHANNPVDWYAWGEEAFARARTEDKPIFLSIGYSTCHWCHVMEHESFEDAGLAEALNRDFVSIKVDREERPDVDRVYMMFVQATTGAGGWPMSVFLAPDLRPFFGGTYFPPASRWGRPGFADVLVEIARAWREDRGRILESARTILDRLQGATAADGGPETDRAPVAGLDALETGVAAYAQSYDARHGGFGGAPKFPRPSELIFLLHAHAVSGNYQARQIALGTLDGMALGGIRDHVGGGFHRYSVDAEWRVPHFEKMLYDQAQLVLAYLEGAQVSGESFYAEVAEDTLAYVLRDMTAPDGSFYSAEDADSLPSADAKEKREGAFYVWTASEIDRRFGGDAPIVRRRFGVEDAGNALADPQGEFADQNILYLAQSIEEVAARSGRPAPDVEAVLARARGVLFDERRRRPRPHLDDKAIAAWNGLMIAAFARAARVLVDSPRREEWRRAAERAATAARTHLWREHDARLFRRYRDGEAAIDAFCEDYACLAWGLLELFQVTGDDQWLGWALDLSRTQMRLFWDERDGGWFSTDRGGSDRPPAHERGLRRRRAGRGLRDRAQSPCARPSDLGPRARGRRAADARALRAGARAGGAGHAAHALERRALARRRAAGRHRRRVRGRRHVRARARRRADMRARLDSASGRGHGRGRSARLASAVAGGDDVTRRARDGVRLPRLHMPRAGDGAGGARAAARRGGWTASGPVSLRARPARSLPVLPAGILRRR